jgi:hypothetical protein
MPGGAPPKQPPSALRDRPRPVVIKTKASTSSRARINTPLAHPHKKPVPPAFSSFPSLFFPQLHPTFICPSIIRQLQALPSIHIVNLTRFSRQISISKLRNGTKSCIQDPRRHCWKGSGRKGPSREEGGRQEDCRSFGREEEAHQDPQGDLLQLHLQG